jgi:outer membrane receptor for ferrienterochelin and colicins
MVAGNPDLQPETARSLTAGAEWRPPVGWVPDALLLSAGLFRTDIQDLIIVRLSNPDQVGQLSRFSYANVAQAHTQGIEAGLGAALPAGFQVNLGYTFTAARDEEADRALEGQARHRGTFRVGYRHAGAGFSAQARGSVVGARPFYTDDDGDGVLETRPSDGYATLGVRAQQRLWRRFDAFAGADNLLGAGDERYLPVPPRTFYGGVELSY